MASHLKILNVFIGIAIFTNAANSAQLVGSEILLCTNGYSPDNSTCTTYGAGDCESGYYDFSPSATTIVSPTDNQCAYASYKAKTLPDTTISVVYHGAVLGDEITLCTNGYSPDNSTCSTYARGDCETNYYELEPSATSFVSPSGNMCNVGGYKSHTMPDTTISVVYHGAVLGNEITLCTNGYSPDNSTCTTYTAGDCPESYVDIKAGATSFVAKNGSCASGYKQYTAEESCGYMPSASTCVSLCENGQLTTGVGTCGTLCTLGITTLRTSNGVIVPLWSTKQTQPSINIGYNNGICYGNLTTESTTERQIYVQWDTNKYHTTK